ncbi:hypothetical protein ACLSU7_15525 [Bdellovibrio sp. HCB185ZH]|uniref:hypothetical protein n=1 Tax=Bdellovibrio sp. HCB185ZH TaxID=3394235 RepID=UPI0039A7060B
MFKVLVAMVLVFGVSVSHAKKKDEANRKPASIDGNVMVGGDAEWDACGGYGIVLATTSLIYFKDGKMNFDKVDVNTYVSSCVASEDKRFIGIVYGKKGQDCGVGSPIPKRQEYKGPCKSGWIKAEFFELLAG